MSKSKRTVDRRPVIVYIVYIIYFVHRIQWYNYSSNLANMNLFSKHLCSQVYKRIKSKIFLYDKSVVRLVQNKGGKQGGLNFKSKCAGVHFSLSIILFREAERQKIQLNKGMYVDFSSQKPLWKLSDPCRLQPRL